ncbi:MAG: transporter [Sphingobium sp. SCN 64-10]|nr:MAG: transporter [Sphingobium sp. SCN 64-10]
MDGSIARPRPYLALGLRLLSAFAMATKAMLVKYAADHGANVIELIFWRQLAIFVLLGAGLAAFGKLAMLKTNRLASHGKRAVAGLIGVTSIYGAVLLLPLAEATTLSFTSPIFAVLIAVVLFREKIGLIRGSALVIGFLGVFVLMQPGFASFGSAGSQISLLGIGVALFAAFMVPLISYQIQDLNTTENPWSIVFWFAALSIPILIFAMPFVMAPHDTTTWLLIAAMALCGVVAQLLLTLSLRFGSAGVVLLMDYTGLLWAITYGYLVFDQGAPASLWLGAPLIVGAGLMIAYREKLRKQIASKKAAHSAHEPAKQLMQAR